MQKDSVSLFAQFISRQEKRQQIFTQSVQIESRLDYAQYAIRGEFDKHAKELYKHKARRKQAGEQFVRAFKTLNRLEMVQYYNRCVDYILAISKGIQVKFACASFEGEGFTMSYNLKLWKLKSIRLDHKRQYVYVQREGIVKMYDLANYLYRGSRKNHNMKVHVMQAINSKPHVESRSVHIGFKNEQNFEIFKKNIQAGLNFALYKYLKRSIQVDNQEQNRSGDFNVRLSPLRRSDETQQQNKRLQKQEQQISPDKDKDNRQRSDSANIVQTSIIRKQDSFIVTEPDVPQNNQEEEGKMVAMKEEQEQALNGIQQTMIQQKLYEPADRLEFVNRLMQLEDISNISAEHKYEKLQNIGQCGSWLISRSIVSKHKLRIRLSLPKAIKINRIVSVLTNPQLLMKINTQIEVQELKTMIKSQNSALIYEKTKPFNRMYRARDFVFLRHVFKIKERLYIIDKSIEDSQHPPFVTIVRGTKTLLWTIFQQQNRLIIIGLAQTFNEGYLNQSQNQGLTLKYLKGLIKIEDYLKNGGGSDYVIFDTNWQVDFSKERQSTIFFKQSNKRIKETGNTLGSTIMHHQKQENQQFQKYKQSLYSKDFGNLSKINNRSQIEDMGEVNRDQEPIYGQNQTNKPLIDIKLDEQGKVVINDGFIQGRYIIQPDQTRQWVCQTLVQGHHPIWKGQWKLDPIGGIIFINEKKINNQKGVFKFVISQIGKNLLSGKNVLSISLPVDIFSTLSNLQLLGRSLAFAPILLEKAVNKGPLEQFKATLAFGISISCLYLNMEKPFNPVLGETFQCFIQGCPLYLEQISHHPPISAFYFVGRGYKIYAQLESKVDLSMNSGCGSNDGVITVEFQNGSKVCFTGPGGEVSGLAYGDRKFNVVGKAMGWVQQSGLMAEILFNPQKKGGLFSKSKSEYPIDYFQGYIVEVNKLFLSLFNNPKRRSLPPKCDILSEIGKMHGIWHKQLKFEQQIILDIDKQFPLEVIYQKLPLPSDGNWREDIVYRKLMDITRAQKQKQVIEIKQRADRKLRQTVLKQKKL